MIGVWALFGQRILVPRLLSISPADSDAAPSLVRPSRNGEGPRETRRDREEPGHGQGINFHTGSPHRQRDRERDPLSPETDGQIRGPIAAARAT